MNWDSNGVNVGVLPLGATGRQDPREVRRLRAHSDLVTDLAFSPFDDGILATGSVDQKIKIWRIPSAGLEDDLASPELELTDLVSYYNTKNTIHNTIICSPGEWRDCDGTPRLTACWEVGLGFRSDFGTSPRLSLCLRHRPGTQCRTWPGTPWAD